MVLGRANFSNYKGLIMTQMGVAQNSHAFEPQPNVYMILHRSLLGNGGQGTSHLRTVEFRGMQLALTYRKIPKERSATDN